MRKRNRRCNTCKSWRLFRRRVKPWSRAKQGLVELKIDSRKMLKLAWRRSNSNNAFWVLILQLYRPLISQARCGRLPSVPHHRTDIIWNLVLRSRSRRIKTNNWHLQVTTHQMRVIITALLILPQSILICLFKLRKMLGLQQQKHRIRLVLSFMLTRMNFLIQFRGLENLLISVL